MWWGRQAHAADWQADISVCRLTVYGEINSQV